MEKVYRVPRPILKMRYYADALLCIFIVLFWMAVMISARIFLKGLPALAALLMLAGIITYNFIKKPYMITLRKDSESLIFKSVINEKVVMIKDIKEIEVGKRSEFIYFKLSDGKITMVNYIDNLHELIFEIEKVNNDLITKGC